MAPLNPYQSPRALDGQSGQRPWFALPRVFPKYRVERILIVWPLIFALVLAANDCVRGLLRDMYTYAELSGKTVTYFNAPHWDEAAWGLGALLTVIFAFALACNSTVKHSPRRSSIECALAGAGVVICFVPLLLDSVTGRERYRSIYNDGSDLRALGLTVGLALLSGLFQVWFGAHRRQAALAVFRALRVFGDFCRWIIGQRVYRRPGRP